MHTVYYELFCISSLFSAKQQHEITKFCIVLRREKLNYKSVAKEISKPPFLTPEVQWESKFTVVV